MYDVLVIGGSFAGLSAALGLGRSLRSVLVIDAERPANRKTARAHNFLTRDGDSPDAILAKAKGELARYPTIRFHKGVARSGTATAGGFAIQTESGDVFFAGKVLFTTGVLDLMPPIEGISACWGKTYLHCPYCHGYEFRFGHTGVWGNGDFGFDLARHIHQWAKKLTLFTNGPSRLRPEQVRKLTKHQIAVVEDPVCAVRHTDGQIERILFQNGRQLPLEVLFGRAGFRQSCALPVELGCSLTDEGYLQVDECQRTSVPGLYAAGDNSASFRTLSNAVASGTRAGAFINKDLIEEAF